MHLNKQNRYILLLLITLLVTAFFVSPGSRLFGDSPEYIAASRSLVDEGVMRNVTGEYFTQWAPLPSILMTPASAFNIDIFLYSQVVFFVLFILTGLLLYQILRLLRIDELYAYVGVALLMIMRPIVDSFSYIGSDAFFVLFVSVLIYSFIRLWRSQSTLNIVLLVLSVGLLALTRYASLPIVLVLVLGIFLLPHVTRGKKLAIMGLAGGVYASFLGIWMVRNSSLIGSSTSQSMEIHYMDKGEWLVQARTFFGSLTYFNSEWLFLLFSTVVAIVLIAMMVRSLSKRNNAPSAILLTAAGLYIIFFLFTFLFVDKNVYFEPRYLVVICVLVFSAGFSIFFKNNNFVSSSFPRWLIVLFGIFFVVQVSGFVSYVSIMRNDVLLQEKELHLLQQADLGSLGTQLYSNAPQFVYLATGQYVRQIPFALNRLHHTKNVDYDLEQQNMIQALKSGAAIVLFKGLFEVHHMTHQDIADITNVVSVVDSGGLIIYTYDEI